MTFRAHPFATSVGRHSMSNTRFTTYDPRAQHQTQDVLTVCL